MSDEEHWKAFFTSGVAFGFGISLVTRLAFDFPSTENLVIGGVGMCACLWAWKVFDESLNKRSH